MSRPKEAKIERRPKSFRPKRQLSRLTYMYKRMGRPSRLRKTKSKPKPSLSQTFKARIVFHSDPILELNEEPSPNSI
ncbi:hypothetical protein CR513_19052, partial [Mucuna pruriens]